VKCAAGPEVSWKALSRNLRANLIGFSLVASLSGAAPLNLRPTKTGILIIL
jgi:hypothetical protein